jgi:four helix bundle protein
MDLVTEVYRHSQGFPKEEAYGLTAQVRRSAVSVPSNLAEGYGRRSNQEFQRFTRIATASLYELQTQLEISLRLGYRYKRF